MPQRLLRNATVKVTELVQKAITELASLRKAVVVPDVLLLALIEQQDSVFHKVCDELHLETEKVRREIIDRLLEVIGGLPDLDARGSTASFKLSQEVQELFKQADVERDKLGDSYISTASVLLGCCCECCPSTEKVLAESGLKYDDVLASVKSVRGSSKISQKDGESRISMLEEYTTDMTALARRNALDPVVGRGPEISRVVEILSRRKKNNPLLLGEPGVGKTVIVEGLAQQIVNSDVPEYLLNKRVLSLEISTLLAGAKMQGEFEERLKAIKDEVINSTGEIILFIDEIHTVVGAGRSGGGLDASNMLKPALANGTLQCIGATTPREYKQYIESDKALDRRFQIVSVAEPTPEQAIVILSGIREKYQNYHHVTYADEALEKAVEWSAKYLPERQLPDKAIDLVDEAGAKKRIQVIYTPPAMRDLENKRHHLESQKNAAFAESNFEKVAMIQMEIAQIENQLEAERTNHEGRFGEHDKIVTVEDVAAVVSKKTGIPVEKMVAAESEKLKHLEEHLGKRVVGQEHAVKIVANAIRRNRSGLRRVDRPVASFLFLGPTGVGKTELTKAIAGEVLDDDTRIIRFDMGEYMEKHSVAKLIGSPPGYVGYGEGGQLTEKVKHNPYSIVLFDEFEKAHPDVYNLLLPVLDEGWLTDAEGQRVSFRNCVVIGTSNIGSHLLTQRKRRVGISVRDDDVEAEDVNKEIMKEIEQFLRPEFINRLDDIVVFNRLGREDLGKILSLQIEDLTRRSAQIGVELEFTTAARDFVLASIDSLNFGARPLKRKLENLVENQLASLIIENDEALPVTVKIDHKGSGIALDIVS